MTQKTSAPIFVKGRDRFKINVNENRTLFIRFAGIAGLALLLCGYYLFWITPDTAIQAAIVRTRIAILVHLLGNIMVVFYLYKRRA